MAVKQRSRDMVLRSDRRRRTKARDPSRTAVHRLEDSMGDVGVVEMTAVAHRFGELHRPSDYGITHARW